MGWLLGGKLAVLQAAMFDGLFLDGGSLGEDLPVAAEVGISRRHITQALVVALVVIVLDERLDLCFEIAGQVVIFQQDAVLQGLMPAFDFTLGLGMEGGAAHMAHGLRLDLGGQFARDIAGPIVREYQSLLALAQETAG
ncbi:hypothetical protein SPHV1_470051 [Novosphingobium sp. KN65.2]|nr:hypothetical protein SPHV1_470051 [Novosphingobium sp. KN65.2]